MNTHLSRKIIAWALTLCLATGLVTLAGATQTQTSDFDALKPMMDLVASAAESVGRRACGGWQRGETTLTNAFIASFLSQGVAAGNALGIAADVLTSTDQQSAYLSKVFAAKLPTLEAIQHGQPVNGHIGFQPVTVNSGSDSDVHRNRGRALLGRQTHE